MVERYYAFGRFCPVVQVQLAGVQKLELVVADGGNGNYYDHANWADAKFETTGVTTFKTYNPIASEPYILTPQAFCQSQNKQCQSFWGASGFSFSISGCSNGRPSDDFFSQGLPEGLTIDPQTGIITGTLSKAGTYEVILGAKNAKGKAEKKLRIVCGDRIALTPPMGWNSWNCFAGEVSADKVKRAADAMVKSGLINHGWTYINIDDFWENHRDSKDSVIARKVSRRCR